ncbi:hypothetical protein EJB05_57262, partial [Eragrostis curvula]
MASADDVEDPQPAPSITPLIGVEQPDGLKEEEGARRSPAAGSETLISQHIWPLKDHVFVKTLWL